MPEWRNGRRSGLKIHRWRHRTGSSPVSGTISDVESGFLEARFYFLPKFSIVVKVIYFFKYY